ncbi:MAG: hypothetical protein I3273_04960 [Candidatus Moeniiplasma glomeromycotorum]|nr:hypothetical protein [Candidatus Moeniiplasma glomeromycotorum]MCE8167892.1 hypothetical protein [Candidatus Moeniiplasma glomeromycotorum]MCE8169442.1 hypothetical protein [Candidatus Moeniiplasma glomeromycotorum]
MSKTKISSPLSVNCFHCQELVIIKYIWRTNNYSQKNNWGYWTENQENKIKYICNNCLINLYYQHKWEFHRLILNQKKQITLRQYILNGIIKGEIKSVFATNVG